MNEHSSVQFDDATHKNLDSEVLDICVDLDLRVYSEYAVLKKACFTKFDNFLQIPIKATLAKDKDNKQGSVF